MNCYKCDKSLRVITVLFVGAADRTSIGLCAALYLFFFCVYFNYFGLLWAWLSVCDQTFHFTPLRNVLFIHLLVDCRVVHQTLSSQSQPHSNWCLFTRRQHGHAVCWLSQQRLKTFTSNICVEFIQSNTVYKIIRIPLKKDVMLYLMLRIYNI